jgi:hypothetical protein
VATEFHNNALGGTPSARGMEMQSADDVVKVIERVIDEPAADVYTNPSSADLVHKYYRDIRAFEDQLAARTK